MMKLQISESLPNLVWQTVDASLAKLFPFGCQVSDLATTGENSQTSK